MTVYLGSAVVQGSYVVIQAPEQGFGGMKGCRMTNYTADAIILNNITGDTPGAQEYLMPFQQAVYKVENVRQPPTAQGVVLGSAFAASQLFVEWSDDPLTDFPGTYPTIVAQAPINPANTTDGVAVLGGGAAGTVPASTNRVQTTFYNTGPGTVYWSQHSATVLGAGTSASLPPNAGVTLDGGQTVYLKADASGASVSFFG